MQFENKIKEIGNSFHIVVPIEIVRNFSLEANDTLILRIEGIKRENEKKK